MIMPMDDDLHDQPNVQSADTCRRAKPKRSPASNVGTAVVDVLRWRHYVGQDGPHDRTTRFVLLVIGTFMHVKTGKCFVSFRKIGEYALLSERAVAKHVRRAIE